MKKHVTSLAFVGLLAGCSMPAWIGGTTGEASLAVNTIVQGGAAAYRTQIASFAYTSSSIHHVVLKLYTVSSASVEAPVMVGGSQLQADVTQAVLSQAITFKNLHHDTTYRIKATAYKDSSTATDSIISSEDSNSYRDVVIAYSLTPTIASVPVKLIDRLFAAEATAGIVVTDGTTTNVDEVITAPTAAPL